MCIGNFAWCFNRSLEFETSNQCVYVNSSDSDITRKCGGCVGVQ